jgi:TRAP-type C4-dicarboxylate transport system permease small subunit
MDNVLLFILILIAGGFAVWSQRRIQVQTSSLPPEMRKRLRKGMLTVFLPVMGGIIALTFLLIFLLRPHA